MSQAIDFARKLAALEAERAAAERHYTEQVADLIAAMVKPMIDLTLTADPTPGSDVGLLAPPSSVHLAPTSSSGSTGGDLTHLINILSTPEALMPTSNLLLAASMSSGALPKVSTDPAAAASKLEQPTPAAMAEPSGFVEGSVPIIVDTLPESPLFTPPDGGTPCEYLKLDLHASNFFPLPGMIDQSLH